MLRFLRSHINNTNECKTEDLSDFFSYSKTATHGFPQKSSCLSVDEQLGLLVIGTKDGRIRIVGGEGIEWSTTIESGLPIAHVYFAIGSGVIIVLCDDTRTGIQSFHRCQIVNDHLKVTRVSANNVPKRITCCEMFNREDGNSALLIGTSTGKVFALWTQNLEVVEYLIFQDSLLKRIGELCNTSRRIDKIVVHPTNSEKIFLLFNNTVVILYNTLDDECKRVIELSKPITDIVCNRYGSKLLCAHTDGSYTEVDLKIAIQQSPRFITLFPTVNCTNIRKIISTKLEGNNELIAFTGGIPSDLYGDRYALSLRSVDKYLLLDFESAVIDFTFLNTENDIGSALFILCEQELVAIDVQDAQWRPFSLIHFNPLHASPVTATAVTSHISQNAFAHLCALAECMETERSKRHISQRKWPLRCGSGFSSQDRVCELNPHDVTLLITGHENGYVHIWLTNLLSVRPWISCNTALEFEINAFNTNENLLVNAEYCNALNPDELPLRRAGLFDSFCDDPRLTIVKVEFNPETSDLVVGGRAGQVLVFEADVSNVERSLPALRTVDVDMTEVDDSLAYSGPSTSASTSKLFMRNKDNVLKSRRATRRQKDNYGFVPAHNTLLQFTPTVQVSAIAYNSPRTILAAGNEFGYAICTLRDGELLAKCCLLSSRDIVQISNLDGTLSRFKSVKKSIRQSFRRKKRQINCGGVVDSADEKALSLLEDYRQGEREISQRVPNPSGLSGETPHSLIKVLRILHCRLGSNLSLNDYLFVGTYGGAIFIHHLLENSVFSASDADVTLLRNRGMREQSTLLNNLSNQRWDAKCPLIKEIRLRHCAPIVNIECVQELLTSRLFIFTEEQIRAFMLPTLKSSRYKCKFTAKEGSRIRKAEIILMKNAKAKRIKSLERFIGLITNRGEVYVISLQNPHRMMHVPFTLASDAGGIASAVLSTEGELFYVRPGGSELQRASIAASPNYSAPTPFRDEQFLVTMI